MTQTTPKPGRPRSIDLEGLLETAAQMDLTTITMKALADRLGVGVATVYRYVRDREALVRLASARAAHRSLPDDTGQDWRELVLAYADSMFSAPSRNPALIHAYLDGQLGGELEVEFVDRFLAAMQARGFSASRALDIFRSIGLLAMGAAAASVHMRAHGGFVSSVTTALSARSGNELPHVRAALPQYKKMLGAPDLSAAVSLLLAGISGPDHRFDHNPGD